MQRNGSETLDQLVWQSQQEYEKIFAVLLSLDQLSSQSTEEIRNFQESLLGLQKVAARTDERINEQLKTALITKTIGEQLRCRTTLQQNILVRLKETTSRANIGKSLLASEMQTIRHGRTALTGYRSNSPHQGRIVNKRS